MDKTRMAAEIIAYMEKCCVRLPVLFRKRKGRRRNLLGASQRTNCELVSPHLLGYLEVWSGLFEVGISP